jgi:hypothetical protein
MNGIRFGKGGQRRQRWARVLAVVTALKDAVQP